MLYINNLHIMRHTYLNVYYIYRARAVTNKWIQFQACFKASHTGIGYFFTAPRCSSILYN